MIDPIMVSVATALAAKAAEGLSEAGRAAFASLVRLVRSRLGAEPDGSRALESAERDPADSTAVERLAVALSAATERDPAFGAEVARLWAAVGNGTVTATHGGVVNQQSGTVGGAVVQARDVSGGITFGASATEETRRGQ